MLGLILEDGALSFDEREGHLLLHRNVIPGDTVSYRWGFAWDRADITSLPEWVEYVRVTRKAAEELKAVDRILKIKVNCFLNSN